MANGILAVQPSSHKKVHISKKKCGVTQSPTTGLRCHSRVRYQQRNNFSDLWLFWLVSRGQTAISAQGVYRLQYKRPCRKGSGRFHSVNSY